MLKRLRAIEGMDLSYERRKADEKVRTISKTPELIQILQWESSRDLTQFIVHIGIALVTNTLMKIAMLSTQVWRNSIGRSSSITTAD